MDRVYRSQNIRNEIGQNVGGQNVLAKTFVTKMYYIHPTRWTTSANNPALGLYPSLPGGARGNRKRMSEYACGFVL